MAAKKKEEVKETPEVKKTKPFSEQTIEDIGNEANENMQVALTEEEKLRAEEEAKAEEVKEAPAEETKEEPKEEPKLETPVPPAELAKELASDIAKEVVSQLPSQEQTKKETKTTEDVTNSALKEFFDKHNKNPETWAEMAEVMDRVADIRLEQKLAERDQVAQTKIEEEKAQAEAEEKAQVEAEEADYQQHLGYWKSQLNEMADEGLFPPAVNDQWPAESEQVIDALFDTMNQVNTERLAGGKMEIKSLREIYDHYLEDPREQPPGADAPIAGANARVTVPEQGKTPYKVFRGQSVEDIINEGNELLRQGK